MDYDKSNHKNHSRVKKRKSSGNTRLLLAIVAIVIVVVAGTGIGIYIHSSNQKKEAAAAEKAKKADPEATQEQYEKLKEQVAVDADDPMFRKIDFAAAQAANPDVYAWIWIPGTNIDYPILQSETESIENYAESEYAFRTVLNARSPCGREIHSQCVGINHTEDYTDNHRREGNLAEKIPFAYIE